MPQFVDNVKIEMSPKKEKIMRNYQHLQPSVTFPNKIDQNGHHKLQKCVTVSNHSEKATSIGDLDSASTDSVINPPDNSSICYNDSHQHSPNPFSKKDCSRCLLSAQCESTCPTKMKMVEKIKKKSANLTTVAQIGEKILKHLAHQKHGNLKLVKKEEKFKCYVENLNAENSKLLGKKKNPKLQIQKKAIPDKLTQKKIGYIKHLEEAKNKQQANICAITQSLRKCKEEKDCLQKQLLQLKKEVAITRQLKSNLNTLSNSNRNLQQKMRKTEKECVVTTKTRLKEARQTMDVIVKQLEMDLHNEKQIVSQQQVHINELKSKIYELQNSLPQSPSPITTQKGNGRNYNICIDTDSSQVSVRNHITSSYQMQKSICSKDVLQWKSSLGNGLGVGELSIPAKLIGCFSNNKLNWIISPNK